MNLKYHKNVFIFSILNYTTVCNRYATNITVIYNIFPFVVFFTLNLEYLEFSIKLLNFQSSLE